jgi:hypothetical protein
MMKDFAIEPYTDTTGQKHYRVVDSKGQHYWSCADKATAVATAKYWNSREGKARAKRLEKTHA